MHLDGQYVRTEGVNLLSSMSGKTGIAEGARGLAEALRSAGIPMRHIDSRATPGRQLRAVTRENERIYDTTLVVGGLEEIRMSQREERGRIIGYIPWELCAFPHAYRKLLETFDEVWTLSRFSAEALSGGLSIPVIRMPLAVDVQNYSNKQRADFGIPRNAYVFLFTFDFHSAMERKNPEGLIKSFVQSFAHNKNIFLVIHGVHSSDFPSDVSILKSTIDGYDNIMLHTHYVSRPDLLALLRCADCFVSLHRSEGFGLAIAESMALGIPVIATDYGGSTDFLTNETGYPVPYSLTTLNKNIGPYPAGALWAEPDTDHASELMRKIIENPEEVTAKAHTAKKLMQTEYSLQAIGQRMKERLLILRDAPTSSKRSSP